MSQLPDILIPLIEAAARAHGLPQRLVAGIVITESSGNPNAVRYEPAFRAKYLPAKKYPEKEARGRATSWGLMQIMGETARTLGFSGPFETLLDPVNSLAWGCAYLARLKDRYPKDSWETLCRAYNAGPGNRYDAANSYPQKVLRAMGGLWPASRE